MRHSAAKSDIRHLASLFQKNGCIRAPNLARRVAEGTQTYKKGYEVRLVATTRRELTELRRLLKRLGFKIGAPYRKRTQIIQPVYGKAETERFRRLLKLEQ